MRFKSRNPSARKYLFYSPCTTQRTPFGVLFALVAGARLAPHFLRVMSTTSVLVGNFTSPLPVADEGDAKFPQRSNFAPSSAEADKIREPQGGRCSHYHRKKVNWERHYSLSPKQGETNQICTCARFDYATVAGLSNPTPRRRTKFGKGKAGVVRTIF